MFVGSLGLCGLLATILGTLGKKAIAEFRCPCMFQVHVERSISVSEFSWSIMASMKRRAPSYLCETVATEIFVEHTSLVKRGTRRHFDLQSPNGRRDGLQEGSTWFPESLKRPRRFTLRRAPRQSSPVKYSGWGGQAADPRGH